MSKKTKQQITQLQKELSDVRYLLHKSNPSGINFQIKREVDNSTLLPKYTYTLIGYEDTYRIFELPLTSHFCDLLPMNFNIYYRDEETDIILKVITFNRISNPVITNYFIYNKDKKEIAPRMLNTLEDLEYVYYSESEIFNEPISK